MRLAFLLCLLLAACAACAPTDPYSQIAAGEAWLKATQARRDVDIARATGTYSSMTIEQTRQAGEMLAVQAAEKSRREAIESKQTAVALQLTQSAAELQAMQGQATQSALRLQTTIDAGLRSSHLYATQTMIPVNVQAIKDNARRANSMRWALIFLVWGLAFSAIFWLITLAIANLMRAKADLLFQYRRGPVIDMPKLPPPPEPKKTLLSVTIPGLGATSQTQYADLPASQKQLYELASGVLDGHPFSEAVWTGAGRPFSKSAYIELRNTFIARGWADWRREDAPAQGVVMTSKGRAVLRTLAGRAGDPPPYQ